MANNNEVKAAQLGMPLGTASARLKKNILFHILCRIGENVCYRCEKEIETVDNLTIEHKIPWLHNDVALFWDLDNIAFSHLACNIKAGRKPKAPVVCYKCKINPARRLPSGKIADCTSCNSTSKQEWRTKTGRN